MSPGLSQIGATPRIAAYAPAAVARAEPAARAQAAPNVTTAKAVQPTDDVFRARERIREQVMAERGVDLLDLYRMASLERIRAESEIAAETAERVRQERARGLGVLIDLKV